MTRSDDYNPWNNDPKYNPRLRVSPDPERGGSKSQNSGDDPWANEDDYDPQARSSRPANPNRSGSNYNTYGGGRPQSRPSQPSQRTGDPDVDWLYEYGFGNRRRGGDRSARPSQSNRGGYESGMDDPFGNGRSRGGSNGRGPAREDDYDENLPRRPQQAHPPRGSQGSRAQPTRYEQAYGDGGDGDEHDGPSMHWWCTTGRHDDVDDHAIGRCGENEGWFDSRHAAEAALQCAVQCGGYPRYSCQVRPATHPEADPGTWALTFPTLTLEERSMGGEGRRRDERYGGDERYDRDERRSGGRRGGGRPSDGGGGGGGYRYS